MPKFERARIPVGPQFSEKQNDETRREEAGSCPAHGVRVCCERRGIDRTRAAVERFGQTAIVCVCLECARCRKANSCGFCFSFRSFGFSSAGLCYSCKDAGASGERGRRRMDQHGYWRLPQAGNALVWKDKTRQVHVRGGCHKGRVQSGEVRDSRRKALV